MACDDLGAELWALVYHLFSKYRGNPQMAVRELGLRTHREFDLRSGQATPQVPRDVCDSAWYVDMCAAYAALQKSLRLKHQADATDARELVLSLYPEGCNVSEYADAVRTSAALLPFTIPSNAIDNFISKKGNEFHAQGVHVVSPDELVRNVIDELMLSSLIPRQWWCSQAPSVAVVKRVGLRGSPPTLLIEYERPAGVPRVRRIHLAATLRESMPTAQLARRLAMTHEPLLSEAQLQSLLIRCQRLMAQPAAAPSSPPPAAPQVVPPVSALLSSAPTTSEATTSAAKPQKADLGLLYRDPDAALHNVDLNDADDVTLREFKEVMNEKFMANVVKPGDPGYVYDKRVEVSRPAQSSEWDDDSD